MSIAPSIRPSSTWSRGSKSNSGGVPTVSSTTKSSSPPAGDSSEARLGIDISAAVHSCSAADWAASASLTSADRALVWASRACFSSPCACGISLPSCFCSARLASYVAMAARRAESAASARSTTSSDRPRLAWAARTRSGSSRRRRGSIMGCRLSAAADGPHPSCRQPVGHTVPSRPARPRGPSLLDRSRVVPLCLGRRVPRRLRAAGARGEPALGVAGRPRRPRPVGAQLGDRRRRAQGRPAGRRGPLRHHRDDPLHGRARGG